MTPYLRERKLRSLNSCYFSVRRRKPCQSSGALKLRSDMNLRSTWIGPSSLPFSLEASSSLICADGQFPSKYSSNPALNESRKVSCGAYDKYMWRRELHRSSTSTGKPSWHNWKSCSRWKFKTLLFVISQVYNPNGFVYWHVRDGRSRCDPNYQPLRCPLQWRNQCTVNAFWYLVTTLRQMSETSEGELQIALWRPQVERPYLHLVLSMTRRSYATIRWHLQLPIQHASHICTPISSELQLRVLGKYM